MTVEHLDPEALARKLQPLFEQGSASLEELELAPETLTRLGFELSGGRIKIPESVERLNEDRIFEALSERARSWITDLMALEVVGSTSTLLNEMVGRQSIAGVVRLAELQVQGRGRRGRIWQSPYANNLAMSVGARIPQRANQLGGFSLSVGLAVADHLQMLGLRGVDLKWPNDVLIHGRKVAGILIELHNLNQNADAGTEVVIGIGINFHLPDQVKAAIDQPVTDLFAGGQHYSRNAVAGGVLSSLANFIDGFATTGFSPMRESFNRQHHFHDKQCTLLTGDEVINGTVRGVSDNGELLVEIHGQTRTFSSGEVSLRPSSK